MALIYCVWVGGLYLLEGPEPFSRLGVSLTSVIAAYLGGVAGGAIIGLLRPLTRGDFGAFVVGYLAAVPITAGLAICLNGWPTTWTGRRWDEFPMLVLIFGTIVGFELSRRRDELRPQPPPSP
jgi:hypothetical protein